MSEQKIIDGKPYYQIPVDKIFIDGIQFSSTFTTEELLAAKNVVQDTTQNSSMPQNTSILSTPPPTGPLESPSTVSKSSNKFVTLKKSLVIVSFVSLISLLGIIAVLVLLLL